MLLVAHGADPNVALFDGTTPLLTAVEVRQSRASVCACLNIKLMNNATEWSFGRCVAASPRRGADCSTNLRDTGTQRDVAKNLDKEDILNIIDSHLRRQLRPPLVQICLTLLAAADLPLLVLLECFAWSASTTYAAQEVELPLHLQWRIAKSSKIVLEAIDRV